MGVERWARAVRGAGPLQDCEGPRLRIFAGRISLRGDLRKAGQRKADTIKGLSQSERVSRILRCENADLRRRGERTFFQASSVSGRRRVPPLRADRGRR